MSVEKENHFYVQPEDVHDKAALKEAIAFSVDKAHELELQRVILLISTKQSTGHIESAYGDDGESIVRKLMEGEKLNNGLIIKIESKKTYYASKKDFVVCISLDSKEIFDIENEYSVKAIMAIPYAYEINEWVKTWGAYEIRTSQNADSYPELNCVVQKALDNLHIIAYGGTDNSSDHYKMKTLARALNKYEPQTIPASISSYLLRKHKWQTKHALYVQELFQKLRNNQSFNGGDKTGLGKIYKDWQAKCK